MRVLKAPLRAMARRLLRATPGGVRTTLFQLIKEVAPDRAKLHGGVCEMELGLRLLSANGLAPDVIIDVGAYVGSWSSAVRSIFPEVPILMVEANPEQRERLSAVCNRLGNARVEIKLLGPERRSDVSFYSMRTGSSVLPELTEIPRSVLSLPMSTLDAVLPADTRNAFLKLDVQGYELEVLKGGARTLAASAAVVLEISLLPYNEGAPLFAEVVAFMRSKGLLAYDICSTLRRRSDSAIFQIDLVFVREDSPLRAPAAFL
jgi:FkbM family methyltransferase